MKPLRSLPVTLLAVCLLAVSLAVASCGAGGTATTQLPAIGTALPSTGSSTPSVIRDAISQSGRAPSGFEVVGSVMSGDWAGAIVDSPEQGTVSMLLYREDAKGWAVVDVGHNYFLTPELVDRGVPEQVVALIAHDT